MQSKVFSLVTVISYCMLVCFYTCVLVFINSVTHSKLLKICISRFISEISSSDMRVDIGSGEKELRSNC